MICLSKDVNHSPLFAGLILVLLLGCAGISQRGVEPISIGMGPEAVTRQLGEPARREQFAPDRFVYFYDDGPYADRPVCFDKQRVVHVGPEFLDAWREERMALATGGKGGGPLSQGARARVKATLEAERQARIVALERQVKPLPVSATARNLEIYRELLSLDPDNPRYRRKVAFYQERNQAEKAQQRKAAQLAAQRRSDKERKRRNQQLRVYEGNEQVQMAIHELGSGALYLWLKNLSEAPLLLVTSYYRLMAADDTPIAFSVGDELQGSLAPGGVAQGKLTYAEGAKPHRLLFDHPKVGTIEKWFP
jgi:hypothetical protein